MKLNALQSRLIEATGEPGGEIRTKVEALRKDGWITKGGRGPGAPEMTSRDLAVLLLAIVAPGGTTLAADTLCMIARARLAGVHWQPHDGIDERDDYGASIHSNPARMLALLPPPLIGLGDHDPVSGLAAILAECARDVNFGFSKLVVQSVPTAKMITLVFHGKASDPDNEGLRLFDWTVDYVIHDLQKSIVVRTNDIEADYLRPLIDECGGAWR